MTSAVSVYGIENYATLAAPITPDRLLSECEREGGAERVGCEAPIHEEEREAKKKEEEERPAKEAAAQAAKERIIREAGERTGREAAEREAKKREEEKAAEATGNVSLDGATITVRSGSHAAVKLTCAGTATCSGELTLTAKTKGKGKGKPKTETIGTATSFSISSGSTTTIELALNAAGRALLSKGHGRLGATLAVLKSSPSPSQTHTDSVQLVQEKARGKRNQ